MRLSLGGATYLLVGLVIALTHGYNDVSGFSQVLSLVAATVLWPAVGVGVDLHVPTIIT